MLEPNMLRNSLRSAQALNMLSKLGFFFPLYLYSIIIKVKQHEKRGRVKKGKNPFASKI